MQKLDIPCIKTGDFAKLCNTNKRTLIHYDEIGLFQPNYTDEKGYRYYTERQCDTFFFICHLKDLGMPLKEIKEYVLERSPKSYLELLETQQKKIEKELEKLNQMKEIIQTKIDLVTLSDKVKQETGVFLEDLEEEYLLISPYIDSRKHEDILPAIYQHIAYCSKHSLHSGHPYGAMLPCEKLEKHIWDHYAHFFTKVRNKPQNHPYHIKPKGTYLSVYLRGNYYNSEAAYLSLLSYARKHGLLLGEFSYKEGILDESSVSNEAEYLTKISIHVTTCY